MPTASPWLKQARRWGYHPVVSALNSPHSQVWRTCEVGILASDAFQILRSVMVFVSSCMGISVTIAWGMSYGALGHSQTPPLTRHLRYLAVQFAYPTAREKSPCDLSTSP